MGAVELLTITFMIAVNSVFAAYEIALASVSLGRLELLMRENRSGARAAFAMKGRMEASLAVVQLGITLVGVIAAATGGAGAEESIQPFLVTLGFSDAMAEFLAIAIIVAPLTVVTIIFGELVPKVFALRNKEWVCLRLSPVMQWFGWIAWPAVWALEKSVMLVMKLGEARWRPADSTLEKSEAAALQDLRAIAALARTSRLIGPREEGIIVNAARLSSRPIREVALPAEYMSMLTADDTLARALIVAHQEMHTRFPVTEQRDNPQRVVGYVNVKDIVACLRLSPTEPSLRSLVRPILRVSEETAISTCLEQMIREHAHISVVHDATGRITGLVTLEDIIEELVGEIHDEYDALPAYVSGAGVRWIVGGGVLLRRLREVAGADLSSPDNDSRTLSDWMVERKGAGVLAGDEVRQNGWRVFVRKARRQQVLEAQISRESHASKA